jgi:DNA-binding beta-propeller fold protein YncE
MRITAITVILLIMGPAASAARSGHVILPSGWSIDAPPGAVAATATMPQGLALSPNRSHLAVVDSGAGPADLRIYDVPSLRQSVIVALKGAFGKPVWEDDRFAWVALANLHAIARIDTQSATVQQTIDTGSKTWPAAVALSPDHARAAVSDDAGAQVIQLDLKRAAIVNKVATTEHPGDLAYSPDGKVLAVAMRGSDAAVLFDSAMQRRAVFHVGSHPSALTFTPDGKMLLVAVADDDSLRVIDVPHETMGQRIQVGMHNAGASPNALTIGSGGALYVSCGALNSVAVVRNGTVTGRIASGWYADGVAIDDSRGILYVLNGKGEGSHANPQFNPFRPGSSGYVAEALVGSVRAIALSSTPSVTDLPTNMGVSWKRPVATVVRAHGPIQHIIYIIKENPSYDQVLGDLAGGDGDAALTIFRAQVTPNQHALAQRFGLFDRALRTRR